MSIAKKHNQVQGAGVKHNGPQTLLVSSNGAVAVAWVLSGVSVLPTSRLVVIVGPDGRVHSTEEDDFVTTSGGGMVHSRWWNRKLKATTGYSAAELAQAAATEQSSTKSRASVMMTQVSGDQAPANEAPGCMALWASVMLFATAVVLTCLLASWACLAALAVEATLAYQVQTTCST